MPLSRIMASNCANPYCPSPKGGMRPPTSEEIGRFRGELDRGSLDRLDRNEITLQVCATCGTWAAETWDSHRNAVVRQFVASPFRFNVEDRVKVTLEGKHHGLEGVVTRRTRWSKNIIPPPPPENVYFVVLEEDSTEHGYGEANLVGARGNE